MTVWPMPQPNKKYGCVIENGWCLFPWSSKGISNKMPQPWTPPRGKLGKRLYVHSAVEMKQPHTMTEPRKKASTVFYGSVIVPGCFVYTAQWKYSFFRFFPWRNLWLRHFVGYSFGISRKKALTIFYDRAFSITQPRQRNGLPEKISKPFLYSVKPWWRIR